MLVTNFTLVWAATERTEVRLRLSNLEAVPLVYAVDFVFRQAVSDPNTPPPLNAQRDDLISPGSGLAGLLGLPHWIDVGWRASAELWIKTVHFALWPGKTESISLSPWSRMGASFRRQDEGYAILRLPSRRDPRNLLRRLPQLDRPARALLAAEAALRQLEWPPLEQRFVGYAPPKSLIDSSRDPVYAPAARPTSEIVHALPLATGRAEVELVPEGADVVERIEVERTGAALVDRLERGEAVRGADGFDATDRLAAFLDEIASLGQDPNAVGAMNAFLAQQGSALQLTTPPADPNVPRRRRRQR